MRLSVPCFLGTPCVECQCQTLMDVGAWVDGAVMVALCAIQLAALVHPDPTSLAWKPKRYLDFAACGVLQVCPAPWRL